jgi:ABC-type polysaccharide/polyol phosphate export permease
MMLFIFKMVDTSQRTLSALQRYGYTLLSLVRRDFKIRYALTSLGFGWTVVQPLIQLLLYTFVFSVIMRVQFRPGENAGSFVLYVMSGFLPYMALAEGIHRASTCLSENRNLINKAIFSAEVLPTVGVMSAAITEIIGLILLIGLSGVLGVHLSAWLILLPTLVLLRLTLTLGFAWLISVLSVFFRDLKQFLNLLLTTWMFLTPIYYPAEAVPQALKPWLQINPLYHLIAAYRAVILEASSPLSMMPALIIWAVAILIIGLWFFRKTINRAKDFL